MPARRQPRRFTFNLTVDTHHRVDASFKQHDQLPVPPPQQHIKAYTYSPAFLDAPPTYLSPLPGPPTPMTGANSKLEDGLVYNLPQYQQYTTLTLKALPSPTFSWQQTEPSTDRDSDDPETPSEKRFERAGVDLTYKELISVPLLVDQRSSESSYLHADHQHQYQPPSAHHRRQHSFPFDSSRESMSDVTPRNDSTSSSVSASEETSSASTPSETLPFSLSPLLIPGDSDTNCIQVLEELQAIPFLCEEGRVVGDPGACLSKEELMNAWYGRSILQSPLQPQPMSLTDDESDDDVLQLYLYMQKAHGVPTLL